MRYSHATKSFSVYDKLPPPSCAGQIVYIRTIGRSVAFVALYKTDDDQLAWFPVGDTPHFEGFPG